MDLALFRLINARWTSPALDILAVALQPAWPGLLAALVISAIVWKKGDARARTALLAALAAVALADLICTYGLKPLVARPRPSAVLEGVRLLVGKKSGFGFPSNHAANIAAAAAVLALAAPRFVWPAIGAALLIGYSRVYAGVHYPSDVVGGYLVGIITGTACLLAAQAIARRRRPR